MQSDLFYCKITLRVSGAHRTPSSGVLKTVTAASGTGHNISAGRIWSRWREVAAPILWLVPEAAFTVFSTPDDGSYDTRNM